MCQGSGPRCMLHCARELSPGSEEGARARGTRVDSPVSLAGRRSLPGSDSPVSLAGRRSLPGSGGRTLGIEVRRRWSLLRMGHRTERLQPSWLETPGAFDNDHVA